MMNLSSEMIRNISGITPAPGKNKETVILTLLCRNEVDTIEANLDFHFALGIDFAIVTDNASTDGTRELLQAYVNRGKIHLLYEDELIHDQSTWVTKMADLAFRRYGAAWLIHSDADEFWLPGQGSIKDYLSSIESSVAVLQVQRSNMLPPPLNNTLLNCPFYTRQFVREVRSLNSIGLPIPGKICHRGFEGVTVSDGNHKIIINNAIVPSVRAKDIEIIHFPVRSLDQLERKIIHGSDALERNTRINIQVGKTWRELRRVLDEEGSLQKYYQSLCLGKEEIACSLQKGILVKEDRVFNVLTKAAKLLA